MKRYYFELLDENFTSLGANIADGSNKNTALNAAKRFMKANGIIYAQLQVNSILTENILDIIEIDLTEEEPAAPAQQPQTLQEATAALEELGKQLDDLAQWSQRQAEQLEEMGKRIDELERTAIGLMEAAEAESEESAEGQHPEQVASKLQASDQPANQPQSESADDTYKVQIIANYMGKQPILDEFPHLHCLPFIKANAYDMIYAIAKIRGWKCVNSGTTFLATPQDPNDTSAVYVRIYNERTGAAVLL